MHGYPICTVTPYVTLHKKTKTYNSGYSLVVTHPTTNPPISSLCMAERTGCPVLLTLWSYVIITCLSKDIYHINPAQLWHSSSRG